MPFINPCHRGMAYGDGYMQNNGQLGQLVKLVGNDLFDVCTNPEENSFGILLKNYNKGDMPTIYCRGGIYETDVYEGTINPGDNLKVSAAGKLTAGTFTAKQIAVAQAISIQSGILKFKLLI